MRPGRFRLTKMVQIFPQSTVSGFMGVIGYKLLCYSFTVGTGDGIDDGTAVGTCDGSGDGAAVDGTGVG